VAVVVRYLAVQEHLPVKMVVLVVVLEAEQQQVMVLEQPIKDTVVEKVRQPV
jgi:hypothetical protein